MLFQSELRAMGLSIEQVVEALHLPISVVSQMQGEKI
jgi:predicted transposase YdaD